MKTKILLIIALAAVIGGGALWIAPNRSWAADTKSAGHKILYYACPMHPSVKAAKPGDCSICGMTLQPVYEKTKGTNAPPAVANTNQPATKMPGCCSPGGCR
jgi:hypothetical protein